MSTAPAGRILAIDTASDAISLAIELDGALLAEHRWQVESTVSRELLGQVDIFLDHTGVSRGSLAALVICIGPGGYGGLRAGIATVQGMALALDLPLAGISRLEADAWPQLLATQARRPVVAVHDARRASVAWGAFVHPADGGAPEVLAAPSITTIDECVRDAPAAAIWCGELIEELLAARKDHNHEGDETRDISESTRAAAMLELARAHHAYGDPAAVDAAYLRQPHITRPN